MTPDNFISKWQGRTHTERQFAQTYFNDLCALLDDPAPLDADPDGKWYCFERGANKTTGAPGWADVWKRERFGWEYKGKRRDLTAAFVQLQQYAPALENPPLLIVSDMETIILRPNWTNHASVPIVVRIEELRDASRRRILKHAFTDPEALRPDKTRQALTEEVAAEFAELARRLRARGHPPDAVAHFVNRLVLCLFAHDTGLLPPRLLPDLLEAAHRAPEAFAGFARELFAAMSERGGRIGFQPVPWFNGGLFDGDASLPLQGPDIDLLRRAGALDWSEVDPSILGTLFERGLDPDKRGQLGAHYTDRAKIDLIVQPVVVGPLLAEWAIARAVIEAAMLRVAATHAAPARARAMAVAEAAYTGFLERLRRFRVLDPACGSGTFLYVALLALKDIEHRAGLEAEALGLQREFPGVGPEQLLGIEISRYAAELARISVWIGHIQWSRRNGYEAPHDPVLKRLDTIECRDALLNPDGTVAEWPAADAIIGNPPFLGDKAMIGSLGKAYTRRVRGAYAGRVPGGADYVAFWFEQARGMVRSGSSVRVGLVATQSIRKGASRAVLDRIVAEGSIFNAWADEPWTVNGAAVRVSIICFTAKGHHQPRLDSHVVDAVHADLSCGATDVTTARHQAENDNVSFIGVQKSGPFDVDAAIARQWIGEPMNPNGRPNREVVKLWRNARHLLSRADDGWIIDFGHNSGYFEASLYGAPFGHVMTHVKTMRCSEGHADSRKKWWLHTRPRPAMRAAIGGLSRYIVTPRTAKHRLFLFLPACILPDCQLVVIARDDNATLGILQSQYHTAWALRSAARKGVGNDPTYNNETCFKTFPFPAGLTPDLPAAAGHLHGHSHAAAIATAAHALLAFRDAWLNPPELVEHVPEAVAGFPDRLLPRNHAAAAILKGRTLTALYNTRHTPEGAALDALHATLDAAVAAAYGWPPGITEDAALAALLALNLARSAGVALPRARAGTTSTPPPTQTCPVPVSYLAPPSDSC